MLRIYSIVISFSIVLLSSSVCRANTIKWCSTWKTRFVDAGHGEDIFTDSSYYYRRAAYARAELTKRDGEPVWEGFLDTEGCTPPLEYEPFTFFQFSQYTWVERPTARTFYMVPHGENWGSPWLKLTMSYMTTYTWSDTTHTFRPNWEAPQANVAVVAARLLQKHTLLEFPINTTTYVTTDGDICNTSKNNSDGNICIDSDFKAIPQWPYFGMDHSQYKFIIGHELGHRQANLTGGPSSGSYNHTCQDNDFCNCEHFGGYGDMCMQSREYIGAAQKEAWAFFYSAALFNERDFNCGMSYWRAMYVGNPAFIAFLNWFPPVTVDCADTPKWMESAGCSEDNRGVCQDWLGFFWNLWSFGYNRCTVDEITDIWEATPKTGIEGEHWDDLLQSVADIYGVNDKYWNFVLLGAAAGVDH